MLLEVIYIRDPDLGISGRSTSVLVRDPAANSTQVSMSPLSDSITCILGSGPEEGRMVNVTLPCAMHENIVTGHKSQVVVG